jgi:GxxExxY protein
MNKLINCVKELDENIPDYNLVKLVFESSENVYKQLGAGHAESTYQKALMYELNLHNLSIDIERNINVCYIDTKGNKHYLTSERIDLYIHKNNSININDTILELKAVSKSIQEQEIVQINKYVTELKKENIFIKYSMIINFPQPNAKSTCKSIQFMTVYH